MEEKAGIKISQLIEKSFEALKCNWKSLAQLIGLLVAGIIPLYILMFIMVFFGESIIGLILAVFIIILAPILVVYSMAITGAMIQVFSEWYEGRTITWKEAFLAGWKKKWRLLGASLLPAVVMIVPILIIIAIFVGLSFVVTDVEAFVILSVVGFIIMYIIILVLAIVVSLAIVFSPIGIMCSDYKAIESLKKSMKFYKGRFWAIIGRLLLLQLIVMAIMTAVQMALFIIMIIPIVNIIVMILLIPVIIFASLYTVAGSVIIYKSYTIKPEVNEIQNISSES